MSYELPIERGKIREFARAVRSSDLAHEGDRAVIPPTFLTTARNVWEPGEQSPLASVDIDFRRILHGEEEYVFHGPLPRAGQTLQVTGRLEREWTKAGRRGGAMRFALIVNEFRDEAGSLVAEQRSTLIQTESAPTEG